MPAIEGECHAIAFTLTTRPTGIEIGVVDATVSS